MLRQVPTMRVLTGIAFVTMLLAISGCATTAGDAGATSSQTTSASSAPSPSSPSPSSSPSSTADAEDPGSWTVEADGIGPLRIGAAFDSTAASLPEGWTQDLERCPWSASWNSADYTVWTLTPRDRGAVDAVASTSRGDTTVGPVGPRTAAGVGVGTSVADARSAYPDAQQGDTAVGGVSFLRVDNIFMMFRDESAGIEGVWVTGGAEPPYDICG